MKKIYFFFFLLISSLFIDKALAVEYEMVTKRNLLYEINGFYIEDNYLKINGWAISDRNIQHYIDDTTHSFSLYLQKIGDTNKKLYYDGNLLDVDKTILFKYATTNKKCALNTINKPLNECYMLVENVGFEFQIPLTDLEKDTSYKVVLRMYNKQANVAYQTEIYAPSISEYQEINGVRYELYSDFSTTNIVMLSDMLFVKAGPSTSSSRMQSYKSCSLTGTTLYWKQWETFTTLQETARTTNSYDSETWFRVLFDQGVCYNGRSRAIMGYSYSGWMPSTYTDFEGIPATIKITTQNYASIDQIKAYTSPKNQQTKVVLKLYNKVNQVNNVKLYQDNTLVYDKNISFDGTKELTINFNNTGGSNVKTVITEPSGYVTTLNSKIYTSSYSSYVCSGNEITINPTTPILVITDSTGYQNIYETIKVSVPYRYIKLNSGRPLQAWSYIQYSSDSNEFVLNSDINGFVLFPEQEETLNHNIVNGEVYIQTIKTSSNNNQAVLNLPEYVLDINKGSVYLKGTEPSDIKIVYGDRKWYVPITQNIGVYDYTINVGNIGVNKISVKFDCKYEIAATLFGYADSLYIIKRTYVPNNLNYIYNKKYSYQDLINIGGN